MSESPGISSKLINLLTTCRLYMNQIPDNINSIYKEGVGFSHITKGKMNEEYDSSLSYPIINSYG